MFLVLRERLSISDNSRHPCGIRRPAATLMARNAAKVKSGIFSYFPPGSDQTPSAGLRFRWLPASRPGQGVHFPPLVS